MRLVRKIISAKTNEKEVKEKLNEMYVNCFGKIVKINTEYCEYINKIGKVLQVEALCFADESEYNKLFKLSEKINKAMNNIVQQYKDESLSITKSMLSDTVNSNTSEKENQALQIIKTLQKEEKAGTLEEFITNNKNTSISIQINNLEQSLEKGNTPMQQTLLKALKMYKEKINNIRGGKAVNAAWDWKKLKNKVTDTFKSKKTLEREKKDRKQTLENAIRNKTSEFNKQHKSQGVHEIINNLSGKGSFNTAIFYDIINGDVNRHCRSAMLYISKRQYDVDKILPKIETLYRNMTSDINKLIPMIEQVLDMAETMMQSAEQKLEEYKDNYYKDLGRERDANLIIKRIKKFAR